MKKVLTILGVLAVIGVLLVGVLIGGAFFMKDQLIKAGVENGGTYALGTPVTLENAKLTLKNGNLTLTTLDVTNPQGFDKADKFTQIGSVSVQIQPASLRQDVIVIDHATLDGLLLNLEMDENKTPNFQPILKRIETITGSGSTQEQQEKAPSDLKVKLKLVRITGLVVALHMDTLNGSVGERVLKLPDFEVTDLGEPDGLPPEALQGALTKAVMEHVKNRAGDLLPQVMLAGLETGLDNLTGLGDVSINALGGSVEKLSDSLGPAIDQANQVFADGAAQATKALQDGSKKAQDALDGASKGLDDALKGLPNPFGNQDSN